MPSSAYECEAVRGLLRPSAVRARCSPAVTLQLLGMPMIPCMMMVLGAVLHKGPGSVNVPPRLIIGVSAFRLIIIPLAGEPFVALQWPLHAQHRRRGA